MSNIKANRCRCCPKRYVSNGAGQNPTCQDVCVNPICGTPDSLTLLAPVVYDELGVNLCRSIPISIPAEASNASSVSVQVLDVSFTGNTATTTVEPINGRPNCYLVTLTNLTVTFLIRYFDCANRILSTDTFTAVYLPYSSSQPDYAYYDEDTNPASIEVEIFAPYGVAYELTNPPTPSIHYVGFGMNNNSVAQGLNMMAIPKILNFDPAADEITVGLSVLLESIYFIQYLIPHNGKAVVPKACPQPDDDTLCMDFVCGDLLELSIKPLELGPPKCEGRLKTPCTFDAPCSTQTSAQNTPPPEPVSES